MWANYLGIAALIAPEAIYALWQIDTNPRLWWILGLGLILLGILGRLIDQGMTRSPVAVMVAALFLAMAQVPDRVQTEPLSPSYTVQDVLAVAVPLIRKWEGAHRCDDRPALHCSYLDTIADPPVWTACHGETRGIKGGMRFTDEQCRDMLAERVLEFRNGWRGYLTPETRLTRLHAPREAAFTSLAYNVGIAGAGRSTATRRLNGGDVAGACTAIGWWNKAGGRVVRGLVNRRAEEVGMCRRGLTS
jgi:GH24 family phage-related lysozyme (muramidase)